MTGIIDKLLASEEPSIRYRILAEVLDRPMDDDELVGLRQDIRACSRVTALLSERDENGMIPRHPYAKWTGAHWVLASLADLSYPPGDETLIPLRDQVYAWLLSRSHRSRIKAIRGRVRRCASQEGNAIYSLLSLGLADERTEALVEDLISWQWSDGGWNCDKKPEAIHSSFMESLIPLRALALHARRTGSQESKAAAERAADIFLKRKMYRRQCDGRVIAAEFTKLHYPCYWHYDILFGLKVMAEAGLLSDRRCQDALDLLEAKRLPDGGFPAEGKYYRATEKAPSGRSPVDWGGAGKRRSNEFVTARALCVLKAAGRLAL